MKLTASDRSSLVKLASLLPQGSKERRTILSGLKQSDLLSDFNHIKELAEKKPDNEFLESVMKQMSEGHSLSDKQNTVVKKIEKEVKEMATMKKELKAKTASWEVEEWFNLRRPIEGYSYGRILAEEDSIYLELWEDDEQSGAPVFEEVEADWFTEDPKSEAESAVSDMIVELKRGKIPRGFRYIDL